MEYLRVFALSDLHVDYAENWEWLNALSLEGHERDALIVAGDVSDDLEKLGAVFRLLTARFGNVFFVPGNHELWVPGQGAQDSLGKFREVLECCGRWGVHTQPQRMEARDGSAVWIVPLLSWYVTPEQGQDSLYIPKEGRDLTMAAWSDKVFFKWPLADSPADYFLQLNEPHLQRRYDAPVISFSHFLPRSELIFPSPAELARLKMALIKAHGKLRAPPINFSRVAGSRGLEAQIRRLGSTLHVYGHQHRNRARRIEGVWYVSHCLGYPQERARPYLSLAAEGPRLIWQSGKTYSQEEN